ncbi:MAG: hypothetical protein IPJ85_09165 [Flavobacteriales bacterium]|nr:hypothetical protein [Flavobacteriales bacterium]
MKNRLRANLALKAFCCMGFVQFDLRTNGVREHSAEYMELFARVHQPSDEKGFEERLAALKRGA